MNPVTVNSANIAKFGFKATFDLLNRLLKFDISALTEFIDANGTLTLGVGFEVVDPSGVAINVIDFTAPDIVTADGDSTYNLDLSESDNIFGVWKIKGAIKDEDGTIYTVEIPPKEICKPAGLTDDNVVNGTFKVKVDCEAPFIQLSETTNLTYLNKTPASVVKNGVLYYPQGTVSQLAFTITPFQDNRLFTGTYTVRNATTAQYDMADGVYVEIRYDTAIEESVTCNGRLCDIMCCIYDLQADYNRNCNSAVGRRAKEKLNLISIPLMIGTAKERCGKGSQAEVDEIRKILGCECNCEGKQVEPAPVQLGGGAAVSVVGDCGTSVIPTTVGSTKVFTVKTKTTALAKKNLEDTAFTIKKSVSNCEEKYELEFDYEILTNTILVTIQNSTTLKNFLNSLIVSVNINTTLIGLDGKCIINMTSCDYFLQTAVGNGWLVNSIKIDEVVYEAPEGLIATDEDGILAWVNGLGKGVFTVGIGSHITSHPFNMQSQGNIYKVNSIRINNTDRIFASTCKGIKAVVQSVIDFICALDLDKIKVGAAVTICSIASNGTKTQSTYSADTKALALLQAFATAFCSMVDKILSVSKVTCADIQPLFKDNTNTELAVADGLYGVKGGVCSKIGLKELAVYIFKLAQTDVEVHKLFCEIDCGSIPQSCITITDFTGTAALE